jgi:predicted membrane-bound mannosyltransferase/DNA-binding beta-propeller fold protein YncE
MGGLRNEPTKREDVIAMDALGNTQSSGLAGYERSWDAWLSRAYALHWDYLIYAVIFLLAVGTRFYDLGERVMSHDESLHTYYSWRLYDAGDFQHTPLMHGPVLFHAVAFFYFVFGDSDFSARIYTALLGVGMVMFPLLWRRWLGRTGALLASVGLLISPMILYYNRYIREDTPNLFFLLLMIHAALMYMEGASPRRPLWMGVFAAALLQVFASKETSFMYFLVFLTFFGFYWLLRLEQDNRQRLYHASLGQGWQPRWGQRVVGHGLVWGAGGLIGFLASYALFYWQYASLDWWWLAVGVALVLLIRLLPLLWDIIRQAISTNQPKDIVNVALALVILLGLFLFLYGVFTYRANDRQLDQLAEGGVFIPSASASTPDDLEAARSTGTLSLFLGLLLVGFSFGGLLFNYILVNPGTDEDGNPLPASLGLRWLFITLGAALGVAALVALLRLLTSLTFELSNRPFQVLCIIVGIAALESLGFIRSFMANAPRPGLAQLFSNGLARPKSASMIIIAGTIIGGVLAVYSFGVLDILKPDQIWIKETPIVQPVEGQEASSVATPDPEERQIVRVDARVGNALLMWMGLPIFVFVLLVVLIAILKTPRHLPIPWADILAVFLIAGLVFGFLLFVERHTLEDTDANPEPVAIDPNTATANAENTHHNELIIGSIMVALGLSLAVLMWRLYFPHHWDYLRRQPSFDLLIVIGSLIIPWFSAYPVWLAGYTLDAAPLPADTAQVSLLVLAAFWVFTATVGIAWNWRLWGMVTAIFLATFVFFFTTVFTNGNGVLTGMVGSLGYWLEQQGVRRGSQPQYYYTLVLMPLYEFLPLIMASLGGLAGLGKLFEWRTYSLELERRTLAELPAESDLIGTDEEAEEDAALAHASNDKYTTLETDEVEDDSDLYPEYDHAEELYQRQTQPEWLGEFPLLQFIGYWGIMILIALTVAGEKMPWLTTHISVPFILLGGWYAGSVIERIDWQALRRGGWALLVFLVPVFIVALLRALGPLTGGNQPFAGQEQAQLSETYEWMAAMIVLLATGYFIYRLAQEVTWVQTRRIAFAALTLLLAFVTARAAVLAAYRNYDYPTEFLVYAHSGDDVKLTLDEIYYLADRTNEGYEMKVAYDDDSSWPMTWYLRHFQTSFFAGEAEGLERDPGPIEGVRVVVVGNRKNDVVERVLGDNYYRFDYKRLWWPMQEYFNLNLDRVANLFEGDDNPAAAIYRDGLWDIWWDRDYTQYGIAQCYESRLGECAADANVSACYQRVLNDCSSDDRYELHRWPVSDSMYVYIDKEIAAQIWDAGIGGASVASRDPVSPLDQVFQSLTPLTNFGPADSLNGPRGISIAPDGSVYVADTGNSRIVHYDPNGTLLSIIGQPASQNDSSSGTLFQPWGLEVASNGNIYVADTWNHRVQVFSPDGQFLFGWGEYGVQADGATSENALWGPRDLTLDINGNVLVADTGNKRVRVYNSEGVWLRDIGTGGAGFGQVDEPAGLAVNLINGELYVADTWNRRIQAFSPDGVPLREWEVPMWYDARSLPDRPYLAVSPDGAFIAVSDMNSQGRNDGPRVVVYDLSGNPVLAFNAPDLDFNAGLYGVRIVAGLAFAPDFTLYALDSETSRVIRFGALPLTVRVAPVPLVPPVESQPTEAVEVPAEGGPSGAIGPDGNVPLSIDQFEATADSE